MFLLLVIAGILSHCLNAAMPPDPLPAMPEHFISTALNIVSHVHAADSFFISLISSLSVNVVIMLQPPVLWHYCPVSDIDVFKVPDLKCHCHSPISFCPHVYQRERQPIASLLH